MPQDRRLNPAELPQLNLPPCRLSISDDADGVRRVLDPLRGRRVALTPEEWVRQHFVAWMIDHLDYPKSMMANEVAIHFNGMSRRCDTVVYSRRGLMPLMIVEYKAPGITVSQKTFDQIVRYNSVLRARWLVVSNGLSHYIARIDYERGRVIFLESMPTREELMSQER